MVIIGIITVYHLHPLLLGAYVCDFNVSFCHLDHVISSDIPQPHQFHHLILIMWEPRTSASYTMLMRPNKAETAVHGFCSSTFIYFGSTRIFSSISVALVNVFVALTYPFITLTMSFQATSHIPTILHYLINQSTIPV